MKTIPCKKRLREARGTASALHHGESWELLFGCLVGMVWACGQGGSCIWRGMVQRGIEGAAAASLRTSCDRAALSRWRVRLRALLARMQACEHRRGSVYRQHLLQQRDFWWWSTSARACARRLELDSQRSFVRAVRIACHSMAALLLAVGAVRISCAQISSRISSGTTFCAVLVLHMWTRVCCCVSRHVLDWEGWLGA